MGITNIHEAFLLLDDARKSMHNFYKLTGKHISLRDIEERYGEYFVAYTMDNLGWQISKIGGNGVDIVAQKSNKEINIEVKTSRRVIYS